MPFLLKDLGATVAGEPCGFGIGPMARRPVPGDVDLASMFRQAGFIVLGRTNDPEFGTTVDDRAEELPTGAQPVEHLALDRRVVRRSAAAVAAGMVPRRTRTTAAARSASRPRSAAWSG